MPSTVQEYKNGKEMHVEGHEGEILVSLLLL